MTSLLTTVIVDALVVLLLSVTILLCYKLNKRIRVLQDSKSDLAKLISQFDDLTVRATNSIADIHAAGKRINENMQHQLDKANFLADDLSFMIEKGTKLADRMEGNVSGKTTGRSAGDGAVRGQRRAAPAAGKRSAKADAVDAAEAEASPKSKKKNAALEEVLEKMSGRKESAKEAKEEGGKQRMGVRLRSKAEQELYEGMKEAGNS